MIRPHVVTFVDQLMRDPDSNHRVAEVVIESGSNLAGATLGDSRLGGRTDILVLAIQPSDGEGFVCNPDASTELTANTRLVVLGEIDQLPALRELARAN